MLKNGVVIAEEKWIGENTLFLHSNLLPLSTRQG